MTPSHYAGKQTIDKQEAVCEGLIARGLSYQEAFCISTAIKYTDRAGDKDGESFEKDINKACDYLARAVHHLWPWEIAKGAANES